MKKEMKKLTTQLDEMIENINQYSKKDITEIRQGISDLIALAEKAQEKHKQASQTA